MSSEAFDDDLALEPTFYSDWNGALWKLANVGISNESFWMRHMLSMLSNEITRGCNGFHRIVWVSSTARLKL